MLNHRRPTRLLPPVRESNSQNFFLALVASQRFLAIIGLVFLVAITLPLARTYNQRRLVEKEIAEVEAQIQQFEEQTGQLGELLGYLQSEQSLEEQARQSLNLKKPGEVVVVIENQNAALEAAAVNKAGSDDLGLVKWWRYFFD